MRRTLDRYVLREILGPFGLGVGLLTFALVTGRLLKLTEMVVNHGVTVGEVFGLIALIIPGFLELTFPMAVLLGVLLGFGRMSGDHELTAARACGISLYRLAAPVMAFAMVVYLLSSWFAFDVRPRAAAALRTSLYRLTQTRTSAGLKEKVFNRNFPGLVVYVDAVSPSDGSLGGVMISDERNPAQANTIMAPRGILIPDEAAQTITLRLFGGSIYGVDADNSGRHVTSFKVYDLTIRPGEFLGIGHLDPEEMPLSTLRAAIAQGRAAGKRDFEAEAEYARKFTVPIATLLFAPIGVALGLKPARGGQSERFGLSVALFFLYYSLMRAGQTLAELGRVNSFIALSVPDVVFAILAVWLFYRSATDRADDTRGPGDVAWEAIERLGRRREAA